MKNSSARQKGKDLEDFVAEKLRYSGVDRTAKREIGSGSGLFKGDIHTQLDWTFECKNTKRFDWKSAAEQVAREGLGYKKECIVWHPPNKPMGNSVAIININDFIDLLKGESGENYQAKEKIEVAIIKLKDAKKLL